MAGMFGMATAGSLLILAAAGQGVCVPPKPTEIKVIPTTKEITFDEKQPLKALQDVQVDTVNPYGLHSATVTQGFMKGAIKMLPSVSMGFRSLSQSGGICLWYEQITVDIEIDPGIVIAREVSADPCMRKAVLEHEMKHVNADRALVNKYAKSIGQSVYDGLKKTGFYDGPFVYADAQDGVEHMQKTVFDLVEKEYKKMEQERTKVQGAIDSLEEYEYVNALCPDFKRPVLNQK